MPEVKLYPNTEIIFEDTESHPLACSFLIRVVGWHPELWRQLLGTIEDKEKVGAWWRIWEEDFYKVVKKI